MAEACRYDLDACASYRDSPDGSMRCNRHTIKEG